MISDYGLVSAIELGYAEDTGAIEVLYIVFVCPELVTVREANWLLFSERAPPALIQEVNSMTIDNKLVFLLSGFRSPYIREWQTLYEPIACLAHELYSQRLYRLAMM